MGANAGGANISAAGNCFFGANAGAVSNAADNSFFGTNAGDANNSGFNNSFFGINAGGSNIDGHDNAYFGSKAGLSLATGNENEIEAIRELEVRPGQYAETFIKFDQDPVIARLEPTSLDYWIATTDPADNAEELKLRQFSPELKDFEILMMLSEQYPNGVKKSQGIRHEA